MSQGMQLMRTMIFRVPRKTSGVCMLLVFTLICIAKDGRVDGAVLPISPGSWSLAILPDTQGYVQTPGSAPIFDAQTQFLHDNAANLNLQYVLHEGDIIRRTALSRTLATIAAEGPDAFYKV